MNKQSSMFFGRVQEGFFGKDGENPSVPLRRFRAPKAEDFEIRFSNTTVTQFGGYPLWHMFCQRISLNQGLSRALRWKRGHRAFTPARSSSFSYRFKGPRGPEAEPRGHYAT